MTNTGHGSVLARRWAWAPMGAVATAGLVMLAGAALRWAGSQAELVWWLRPDAPLTAMSVGAATAAALVLYALPARRRGVSGELAALGSLALIASLLSLSATVRCSGPEDSVLSPLWHTLTTFVGSTPPLFEPGAPCDGGVPLAMQLSRFAALTAVFWAAIALGLRVVADSFNPTRDRLAAYHTVVIGADDESPALVQSLMDGPPADKPVVLLAKPGQDHPGASARALGATVRVIPELERATTGEGEAAVSRALARFLARRGRATATTVWIMDADPGRAVSLAGEIRNTLLGADLTPLPDTPRLLVRIDDRHEADRLRAEWVLADSAHSPEGPDATLMAPVRDPVCADEVTAAEVIGRVASTFGGLGVDYTLVLCGDTPLAEALLAQVGLRLWESSDLQAAWDRHTRECSHEPACTGADLPQAPGDLFVGGRLPSQVVVLSPTATPMAAQVIRTLPHDQRLGLAPRTRAVPVHWRELSPETVIRPPSTDSGAADPGNEHGALGDRVDLGEPRSYAFVLTEPLTASERHLPQRLLSIAGTEDPCVVWLQPPRGVSPGASSTSPAIEWYAHNMLLLDARPEDLWTRVARHAHERYRREHWQDPAETHERLPWWAPIPEQRISDKVRADNLHSVRQTLDSATRTGWIWVREADAPPGANGLDKDVLEIFCEAEYLRWRKQKASRSTPEQMESFPEDWPPPTQPDGSEWPPGSRENRERTNTMDTVRSGLELMKAYGYIPVPADSRP